VGERKNDSKVEVLNVSPQGFWPLVGGREFFLAFANFPWFRNATLQQLFTIELLHGDHLYWPELDVDLDLERIQNPENFPLVAKTQI
jgi:Protein of unknown function (DUF2442)